MPVSTEPLYDADFYAWTQQQAELLRRLPTVGNELDPERIAEEIEDLGAANSARRSHSVSILSNTFSSSNTPGSTSPSIIGSTKSSNGASSSKKS